MLTSAFKFNDLIKNPIFVMSVLYKWFNKKSIKNSKTRHFLLLAACCMSLWWSRIKLHGFGFMTVQWQIYIKIERSGWFLIWTEIHDILFIFFKTFRTQWSTCICNFIRPVLLRNMSSIMIPLSVFYVRKYIFYFP